MAEKSQPLHRNPPFRQIRAHYDANTITLYSAYNAPIANPAVTHQILSASPSFLPDRMTWFKPSWNWMMYRSGYSFKDSNQSHILATKLSHAHFKELLMNAVVCNQHGGPMTREQKERDVRVQWDPERGPRLEVEEWRSLQIGVKGDVKKVFVEEWVVGIEDLSERAREMKSVVDGEEGVGWEELVEGGIVPEERVYEVDEELAGVLEMGVEGSAREGKGGGGGSTGRGKGR